jgi:trans-2,3-dihydro-3-hydroxyanthranilate isomerase
MKTVPFALYNAFTDVSFGGSPAGIVTDAAAMDTDMRRKIAREVGAAATSFVEKYDDHSIDVQFFSTVAELPMCGHGTVCLISRMIDLGVFNWHGADKFEIKLNLPATTATVEVHRRGDGLALVLLDVKPPGFRQDNFDKVEFSRLLGLDTDDYQIELPMETACGDFTHLVVPVKNLATMRKIKPNFDGIVRFCHAYDIQTVVAFCREVENADNTLHVRDFCPAVGVAESAAAGTTNAALTSYLIRHGLVEQNDNGQIIVLSEQGYEINRPSSIRSIASMDRNNILRLQVGGVATPVMVGQLHFDYVK